MDELITKVCTQLGIDEAVAKQAVGAILCFLKEQIAQHGGDFDFEKITSKLKGALELMKEAPKTKEEAATDRAMDESAGNETTTTPPPPTDEASTTATSTVPTSFNLMAILQWILSIGPIMEILKKVLGTLFGENAVQMLESARDSADLMAILNNLGISTETAKSMVTILVSFMNTKLDPETMDQLAENVPALKPFLDATKKDE